ncbi:MAG: energy transducer TonB, partial [Acidobacteriota bacterium]
RQPRAVFPPMAKRFNKQSATVTIRVLISENGDVIKQELAGKKAGYGFDEAALTAAEGAKYDPATKDGVPVKMWSFLRVVFQ